MNEKFEEKLIELIRKNSPFGITNNVIHDNCDLINDLGYDSLNFIQLIIDIEKEFEIDVDEDKLSLEFIGIYKFLRDYIKEKLEIRQNIKQL